jgi:hypothetical protein
MVGFRQRRRDRDNGRQGAVVSAAVTSGESSDQPAPPTADRRAAEVAAIRRLGRVAQRPEQMSGDLAVLAGVEIRHPTFKPFADHPM